MIIFLQNLSFTSIAIISAVFGSVAIVWARVLLKDIKARDILGINFLTMGIVLLLISPLFYYFKFSWLAALLLILIAVIDTVANYFYFKTFENTEASVAAPILSLAPGFTFFFGWLFIGDKVSWYSFVIAILIIIIVVFFSIDFKNFKYFKTISLTPAIISSLFFGLSAIPTKYLLSTMQVTNAPTLYMFRAGLIALFSLLFFRFPLREISVKQYRQIFLRSLFVIGQWVLLYLALSKGNAGVTVTLANITPIFAFMLGAVLLKEKITFKKLLAAIMILFLSLII